MFIDRDTEIWHRGWSNQSVKIHICTRGPQSPVLVRRITSYLYRIRMLLLVYSWLLVDGSWMSFVMKMMIRGYVSIQQWLCTSLYATDKKRIEKNLIPSIRLVSIFFHSQGLFACLVTMLLLAELPGIILQPGWLPGLFRRMFRRSWTGVAWPALTAYCNFMAPLPSLPL